MKQQDIAVVIVIVFMVGIASFIVSSKFITPGNKDRTAYTVSAITRDFQVPPKEVFNENAKNPTVRIKIAPSENENPFSNDQQ